MASDIKEHFNITISSPPSELFSIPRMIVFLLGNILSQYVCARSIFQLSSHYSSLTITMLLTLRKFVSIIISVSFLGNIFTAWHWVGTVLVFAGTSIFSYDIQRVCIKKIQWIIFFLTFVILTSPSVCRFKSLSYYRHLVAFPSFGRADSWGVAFRRSSYLPSKRCRCR